jgi:hypothetical protein
MLIAALGAANAAHPLREDCGIHAREADGRDCC